MSELARGAVGDRPWGRTLGALGTRGLSGQLTLLADGKPYRVAFSQGAVVGASSPLASDAAVRIALTGGLVTSTQVADITRRIATNPDRDEVEVLAEAAKLPPDHAMKLRRRLVAQRAARTFSVERGDFVVEDHVDVPVVPGSELDIRAVIYLGARSNLSEERLAAEVGQLGGWFKLKPEVVGELAQFGFTEPDKPVLQKLVAGANLGDLEHGAPDGVGAHGVRAIVYALVSCNACEVEPQPRPSIARTTRETFDRSGRATGAPVVRRGSTNPPIERRAGTTTPPTERPGSVTPPPRDLAPAPSGTSSVDVPEGMQLRTPSTPPAAGRALTPTTPPAAGRALTPSTAPAAGRALTPSTAPAAGRALTPSTAPAAARTPTPTGPTPARTPTGPTPSRTATPQPASARTPTPTGPQLGRSPTDPALGRAGASVVGRVPTTPSVGRTPTPSSAAIGRTPTPLDLARTMTPTGLGDAETGQARARAPMPRVKRNTAAAQETEGLIRDRLALLDRGADHFVLLGITQDASPDVTRAAYFTLARKLHPDRLASLGIGDAARDTQRLFAQINNAFAVLNDPIRRIEYVQILGRGGESAVRAEEAKADELAMSVMHAEEAFRRGEMALRREQLDQALVEFTTAVELQPKEAEYQAMLAWTKFAAASDKPAIAADTRRLLMRAVDQNEHSPAARFYLGRVERILGREREALSHFQEVLRIKPNHAEASSEIRVLEARLKKR